MPLALWRACVVVQQHRCAPEPFKRRDNEAPRPETRAPDGEEPNAGGRSARAGRQRAWSVMRLRISAAPCTPQAATDRSDRIGRRTRDRVAGRRLAGAGAAAAAQTAEAAGLVEPLLLTLGPEEPTVPQLAQDSRALHGGLKPFEQLLAVFTIPKRYERQFSSPPRAMPDKPGARERQPSVNKYSGNAADAPVAVCARISPE